MMAIHPDDATATLSATIASLRSGAKPSHVLHGGGEVEALHVALRKRGWAHGWGVAVKSWPIGRLLEVARDAHDECDGGFAGSIPVGCLGLRAVV